MMKRIMVRYKPSYFIVVTWQDGRIAAIRDFRYVAYIAAEAELVEI